MSEESMQEYVAYHENKLKSKIVELEEHNDELRQVNAELRSKVKELDKSNLELAQENKGLRLENQILEDKLFKRRETEDRED